MAWANRLSQLSHAKRLQVGAVIVKDDTVISYGYNGMPADWENDCEDREWMGDAGGWLNPDEIEERWPFKGEYYDSSGYAIEGRYRLKTKPEVLHAESNAIAKLAKSNNSGNGADIFITHAPCLDCAKLVYQAGIKRVYFGTAYRDDAGVKFLERSGIAVKQIGN